MADILWYALDGAWHKSVANRVSALHLHSTDPNTRGCSVCRPMDIVLFLNDGYTEEDAKRDGRTLCKACLRHSSMNREKQ